MTAESQRHPPQTIHGQIIAALTREIAEGRFKPNDRLPSENQLCEQWRTSRTTVRKALDQLSIREVIFRIPGKGSFVAIPKISQYPSQILSFREKFKELGLDLRTKLLRKEVIRASGDVARFLKIEPYGQVLLLQRLHMVRDEPMVLISSFMPLHLCRPLLKEDLEAGVINDLLRDTCHVSLSRSEVWIEAPIVSRKEKLLLGNPHVPLFLGLVGLTFTEQNEPIRFSRGLYRGDRVRMKVDDPGSFRLDCSDRLA